MRPLTLLEELEVEYSIVPARRGELYKLAAKEIKGNYILDSRWQK